MKQRKLIFALLALLLILAGCKAESPTAPPVGGGAPPTGVTPPTNATITLTATPASPVVNSNVTINAHVTVSGQNVPNGTAVQFTTTLGTFTDTGANSTLKVTTNGDAKAILTSAVAGTATVTAIVNNVNASIQVTFGAAPVTPQPPSTTPTITSISPTTGRPQGGEQVTITGTNFRTPVRVLFDPGSGGTPKEAFVVSVTPTQIVVLTPPFDLGTGQTLATDVIVITEAGTATEQRVVRSAGFTFASPILTPVIRALQPTSGPVGGGTRVTIVGDAFQQPVQVFFGAAEAQIISVNFSQIIVMSPRASDTTPNGSGVVTGPVDIKVVNVNSNKSATFSGGFRYVPKMQITTAGPTEGPFSGGTRVHIDGTGFDQPLAVVTAGVAAQVISVSGTEIVAITNPVTVTGCAAGTPGPITVTNTNNGDTATGPTFTFLVPKPLIISLTPNPANLGGTVTVVVLNALGFARFTIGDLPANIVSSTVNPDGTTTFVVNVPSALRLSTQSCPAGGTSPVATSFNVIYTSASTGCTTTPLPLIVNPPSTPVLFANPGAFQPFTATITKGVPPAPPFPGTAVTPSSPQTVQIINTGTAPLDITSITQSGAGCAQFAVAVPPIPPTVTLNTCEALPIIVTFNGQSVAPSTVTCTLTVTTSAGTKTFLLIGTSQ